MRYAILNILILIIISMPNISFALPDSPIIPRKILFDNPDKTLVTLSPDGEYISYLAPKDGVLNIWVAPINDLSKVKPLTDDKNRGIQSYYWAFDGDHLLYMQDNKGDENFRIYSLSIKSGKSTLITPEQGVKALMYGISEKVPNTIVIGMNNRDPRYFDLYKVNILDNTKELLIENNKFTSFILDDDLHLRFALVTNEDGSDEYYELKDNN